jgi:hypothetical protein
MAIAEEDFHPAVRLLLARMETDPEEFIGKGFRWSKTVEELREVCTADEKAALQEKYRMIRMDALHVQAMKIMTRADEGEPEPDDNAPDRAAATALSIQQLQQAKMQQMMAAQQAQQDQKMQHAMQQLGLGGYGYAGNQSNLYNQNDQNSIQQQLDQMANAQPVPRLMPPYAEVEQSRSRLHRTPKPISGLLDDIKNFGLDLAGTPRPAKPRS